MEEKFETAEDVARWLEERGFSQDVTDAFIGIHFVGTTHLDFSKVYVFNTCRSSHGR